MQNKGAFYQALSDALRNFVRFTQSVMNGGVIKDKTP